MEVGTRRLEVGDESCVGEARRIALGFARDLGLNETDAGRAAIVATELSTNLLKHAGHGVMLLGAFEDENGAGVECIAMDKGPGIAEFGAVLRDGYSTAGTSGTGLGAVNRLSHAFDLYSRPGLGSVFLARVQAGDPPRVKATSLPAWGAVSLPMRGEEACGDAWRVQARDGDLSILVVDGLGHGPMAANAAHAAIRAYDATNGRAEADLITRLHQALRPTRGAAASIFYLPKNSDDVAFIGVGNVAGVVASAHETRKTVSFNGTLGHTLKSVRPFTYPTVGETLVVLASDGLGTHWSLDAYPGLNRRHPTLIAATLYRDYDRGRDDVTIVVARRQARPA